MSWWRRFLLYRIHSLAVMAPKELVAPVARSFQIFHVTHQRIAGTSLEHVVIQDTFEFANRLIYFAVVEFSLDEIAIKRR